MCEIVCRQVALHNPLAHGLQILEPTGIATLRRLLIGGEHYWRGCTVGSLDQCSEDCSVEGHRAELHIDDGLRREINDAGDADTDAGSAASLLRDRGPDDAGGQRACQSKAARATDAGGFPAHYRAARAAALARTDHAVPRAPRAVEVE